MSFIAIFFIKFYQRVLSPLLPGSCRFYPSCSNYSIEAFQAHGFFIGLYLTIKRILRCNPFCECGYDPVPLSQKDACSYKLKTENKF
ncbi:MAG: membrane protein insertion efficiency factor YidD [bacterium]